ncbi:MAG: hypothetical protein KBT14_04035 [Proteobacteria bacterium]|nr:hypothetical protein [Candidatus Enterousia onthequi]
MKSNKAQKIMLAKENSAAVKYVIDNRVKGMRCYRFSNGTYYVSFNTLHVQKNYKTGKLDVCKYEHVYTGTRDEVLKQLASRMKLVYHR